MLICPNCQEENPAKFRLCGYCGTALSAAAAPPALPAREVRKTVTLLFSDLKDSTALGERIDTEALHEVKERYFSAMAAQITRHGGKIEKYIGDAIMAVFGLPHAHEDDALRAVRAVLGMREALAQLNQDLSGRYGVVLANRTGLNTGEVVANEDPTADQKLATGDAINVTARLEQAAPVNEIYIGESTYRLVRDAVDAEPVAPLQLKGKAELVAAYRLVGERERAPLASALDRPLVGRDAEVAFIADALRTVCDRGSPQLVAVLGGAGSGKSRIVREVILRAGPSVRALRGRCLSYGEGITFWPLREIAVEAADIRFDDHPASAVAKLAALCGDADVAARLAAAAGLDSAAFPLHELFWAARRFLETLAAKAPLVVVFDDVHRAEPAFLDLIEHLVEAGGTARILVLTLARDELLEARPQWAEGPTAQRLVLQRLDPAAAAQFAGAVLGGGRLADDVLTPVVAAADGNPLFIEQLLSMLVEQQALRLEDGAWVRTEAFALQAVPPTIRALLEARLGRLAREERATIGPASVIGVEFPLPALVALAPDPLRPDIGRHLQALTRRQFVAPAVSADPLPMYRFQNHLVRDTVYASLLKRMRASLHVEVVRWADHVTADVGRGLEFEEILGFHLEQAHRYLSELGPLDPQGLAIGADGSRRLAGAARRAAGRGDMHAASHLYRRAAALRPALDAERLALLPELAEALMEIGEFADARAVLAEAEQGAASAGVPRVAAAARLVSMFVHLYSGAEGEWSGPALRVGQEAIDLFDGSDQDGQLAMAWRLVGLVHGVAGRFGQANEATERYMVHARRAGNARLVARSSMAFAIGALSGPTPVAEAIAECVGIIDAGLLDRQVQGVVLCVLSQLRAMNGEFDPARTLYREGRALLREMGRGVSAASTGIDVARVELLAGDLATAEREVRADYEFLKQKGESYLLSSMAAAMARVVRDAGRDDEAAALLDAAQTAAAEDDVDAQVQWRSIRAPILARRGELAAAEELAREAVALSRGSEAPTLQADSLQELGEVLALAGRPVDAVEALTSAAELHAAKGDIVSWRRCTARRAAVAATVAGAASPAVS